MTNPVFLIGAGASAPFKIPTMQQMVLEFEEALQRADSPNELELYRGIHSFLSKTLSRPVDLEAVFTIVDSIVSWAPERLGVGSMYHASRIFAGSAEVSSDMAGRIAGFPAPSDDQVATAASLRLRFERFVRDSCQIKEDQSALIESVYQSLFRTVAMMVGASQSGWNGQYPHNDGWAIFTPNYDAILEHYWLDIVQRDLNTGFQYSSVARMEISEPERLRGGGLRLFKLHGSITWLLDERWGLTEQRAPPLEMKTFTGRKFLAQVMLYPIEEKELYVEPYMTMYLMLNRELAQNNRWLVIGYSFGDRVIRDIFVRNSKKDTVLVLLHPHASQIVERLAGFRGSLKPLNARFGESDYQGTHEEALRLLRTS